MRTAVWWALPALYCSSLAVPSPASYHQRQLSPSDPSPISRWQSLSDHIINSLFGTRKAHEKTPCHRDSISRAAQFPSSHTLAQYGQDLVLRFNITSSEEAASLAEAADTLLLDIWDFTHQWVDVRLSKHVLGPLLGLLPESLQHSHVPLLRERELAQAIQDTYPVPRDSRAYRHENHVAPAPPMPERRPFSPALEPSHAADDNLFFSDYQPLSVIQPWMRLLASLFTTHVRLIDIGLSYEGRSIPAFRVGVHPTNNEDPNPPKRKTVLIVGSLHAREWISASTVNYIAYSLITAYGKVPSTTSLLEAFDFVLVPTLNPDGYVYTWETDRLWRKNRQRTNIRFCHGIDLDHAFGFEWETQGNPCSESFAGEQAFEAVEARRLADWARNETENNNVEFVGFLDLHSYSQQILYPYSYSCQDPPPGLENLEELAYGLGKAIRMTHNQYYEVLPACEGNVLSRSDKASTKDRNAPLLPRIEAAGGSALDFFYSTIKTRFAYQIKLRDRGTYGFLLPKAHIVPTGREMLNAVLYFGEFLAELYGVEGARGVELTGLVDEVEVESAQASNSWEMEENDDFESLASIRSSVDGSAESTGLVDEMEAEAERESNAWEMEDDDWIVVEDDFVTDGDANVHWGLRRR